MKGQRNIMVERFLKNKKSMISFNVVFHLIEIIFMVTVGIFVFFIIHVDKNIDTFPIESEILFSRILYSNNGLWHYDNEIDRLYPGVLEFKNFNSTKEIEESLRKSMYYGEENSRAAAELVLKDLKDGKEFEPLYYNKEKYDEWVEWYKAGVTEGAGGRKGKTKTFNILIKNKDELTPGALKITILIPNS